MPHPAHREEDNPERLEHLLAKGEQNLRFVLRKNRTAEPRRPDALLAQHQEQGHETLDQGVEKLGRWKMAIGRGLLADDRWGRGRRGWYNRRATRVDFR